MTEEQFQKQLRDLNDQIKTLPQNEQAQLKAISEKTKHNHNKLTEAIRCMSEAMDTMRATIKYMVFDLEATRRENQTLRDLLHKYGQGDEGVNA